MAERPQTRVVMENISLYKIVLTDAMLWLDAMAETLFFSNCSNVIFFLSETSAAAISVKYILKFGN